MARSEDVMTPKAIVAFAHTLFEPQVRENGSKSFGATLLFDKGTDLKALKDAAIAAAIEEWGDKAPQMLKNELIKSPFLDGDGKQGMSKKSGERHAGFAGRTFVRVISGADYKPKVYDRKRNPIMDKGDVPSGSQVLAVVNAFTWENKENGKGISFGISMMQVIKAAEGAEVLGGGGGPDPEKFFEKIPDDDTPAANKGGDASSMFD